MSFIASFTGPFILSVVLWPFASLLLTLPVLAFLYHRDNGLRFRPAFEAYLVVLYLLALVCFTMYPLPSDPVAFCSTHHLEPQLNPLQFISDIRTDGVRGVLQLALNVVFFVPLGFFMGRTFRWPFRVALPVGFLASLCIETAQLTGLFHLYPCAYRLFDVDDLLTNTLGAVIGFAIAQAFSRAFPPELVDAETIDSNPGLVRRFVAFSIDMTLVLSASIPTVFLIWMASGQVGGNPLNARYSVAVEVFFFVLFEAVVPWFRDGRTVGGAFTRMTVETRPRTPVRRAVFHAVRTATLYAMTFSWLAWVSAMPLIIAVVLWVFWMVTRRMPYDLI
ncbi:VanZ family protein [uncultured Bifidobacterium sp.]|uniref:VanZ family protein n=1 Tax=uncultured Bifidobacterium sp. TaxID=165187 RepID=UPI0026028DB7|nr:VanZ family protein [uncultured Bifidobacterium sp.]